MFPSQMLGFSPPSNIFGTSSFTPPSAFHPSSSSQYYRPKMPVPEPQNDDDDDDDDEDNDNDDDDEDDDPHPIPPPSHHTRPRRQRKRPHCGTSSHK